MAKKQFLPKVDRETFIYKEEWYDIKKNYTLCWYNIYPKMGYNECTAAINILLICYAFRILYIVC